MKNLLFVSFAMFGFAVNPSVRNLLMNDAKMEPIFTTLGMSTVLRFPEKPNKIVVGNLDSYTIEFIENDVTIRPKSRHATNLFVYTESNTYGFLLSSSQNRKLHDDLVVIWWKPKTSGRYTLTRPIKKTGLGIPSVLAVKVGEVKKIENGFVGISLTLKNETSSRILTKDIRLTLVFQNEKASPPQKTYYKKAFLKQGEKTEAKLISVFQDNKPFTLKLFFKGKNRSLRFREAW